MNILNLLYLFLFIAYIVQGLMISTGNLVLSTFSTANTSFLLAAWVGIAYMNKSNNKSQ